MILASLGPLTMGAYLHPKPFHAFLSMPATKLTTQASMESVADRVAVSGIIIQDLKERRRHNYKFDWEKMLTFKGDTGVFLQYAHVRLCRLVLTGWYRGPPLMSPPLAPNHWDGMRDMVSCQILTLTLTLSSLLVLNGNGANITPCFLLSFLVWKVIQGNLLQILE